MAGNLKAAELRRLMAKGEFILAPGVYDGISARVADRMGFPALYMTGYGATASMLGLPDAGLATYSDMVGRAEMICSVVTTLPWMMSGLYGAMKAMKPLIDAGSLKLEHPPSANAASTLAERGRNRDKTVVRIDEARNHCPKRAKAGYD